MDRRQRKTREAIFGAFIGLLAEKPCNAITVGEIIAVVTGKEDSSIKAFFDQYHRKIAHFLEFACLGLQIVLLLHFADRRSFPYLLSGAFLSFVVASADEGIQMLTGRGDQVADVFIDVGGYLCAYFSGMLVLYLVCWRCHRKRLTAIPHEKESVRI